MNDLFKDLKAVGDISESARKLFIAMLAACLYSWLTIATTTDVNLITNRASSPLPIIQTAIPVVGFYVVAPLLLLCVYVYFHFYLQKLWEELGSLPAIFPDGRPLHARSDPWLLNDLVRSHVGKLKTDRPFMSYFQKWLSIVLAWWLVPITLLMFWGRYLPRQDYSWYGTKLHVAELAISITAAIFLYRLTAGTLSGGERRSFSWTRSWGSAARSFRAYSALSVLAVTGAVFTLASVGAVWGVRSGKDDPRPQAHGRYSWVPRAMALVHYSPFAHLQFAEVSTLPPNWTGKNDSELDLVKGASLNSSNLRYATANFAFLVNAWLARAHLEGIDLTYGDLRDSFLEEAHLDGAYLIGTRLQGADLKGAHLFGARLLGADLTKAYLNGADLREAHLDVADLTGAYLNGADLSGAYLSGTHLKFVDFRFTLEIADQPSLARASPSLAIEWPSIRSVSTKGISPDALKSGRDWDKAYYNDDLLQKLGLPVDHNEKLKKEQEQEEQQTANPSAAGSTGAPAGQKRLVGSGKRASLKPGSK